MTTASRMADARPLARQVTLDWRLGGENPRRSCPSGEKLLARCLGLWADPLGHLLPWISVLNR